jgi:hypothetical protein
MIYRVKEGVIEAPRTVTAGVNSASIDVGIIGGDSLAIMLVITAASSPSGCTAVLQCSNDNVNFANVGTPTAITANGAIPLNQDRPNFRYYRIAYAIASGSVVSSAQLCIKSDRH